MSGFQQFIESVKGAYDERRSEERLVFRVSDALGLLLQDRNYLQDFGLPKAGEYQTYLLYTDSERGFMVTASTSRDKLYRPPHDHGPTWAVYGVYTGDIDMNRYRRVDDRSRDGYAELDRVAEFRARAGMVDAIVAGGIHELSYSGDGAVSVIVRSGDPGEFTRGRYNAEERTVKMFKGASTGGREQRVDLRPLSARFLS